MTIATQANQSEIRNIDPPKNSAEKWSQEALDFNIQSAAKIQERIRI